MGPTEFDAENQSGFDQDTYTIVNSQIGYQMGRYTFKLSGKNLLDEEYATTGVTAPGLPFLGYFANPRTVAFEIDLKF